MFVKKTEEKMNVKVIDDVNVKAHVNVNDKDGNVKNVNVKVKVMEGMRTQRKEEMKGVGPSALEPFVLAFFPQYKSSEAEGNFKIWYILY